jgi:heptosyltransferase I
MEDHPLAGFKKVLIIRPSSIGDVVMASPMIRVLREAAPRIHLAWLAEPSARDLLAHHPGLDEILVWPKQKWKLLFKQRRFFALKRELGGFVGEMRLRRFDLTIDAQGLLRSRSLAWLSGARTRIGFDSKEPGRLLMTKIVSRGPRMGRMGSEYQYLMQVLGLFPGEFRPEIWISPDDERGGIALLRNGNTGDPYAVFSPFTTRPQKHWVEDRWPELANLIHARMGMPVILLGGAGDLDRSKAMEKGARGCILNLVGQTSLGESAAIIKKASLLVGVDTGLTHMGAAFDCPTIAIFGATCPYFHTAGGKTVVLYNRMDCSPCRRNPVCGGQYPCMHSIGTEKVFQTARELMEAR